MKVRFAPTVVCASLILAGLPGTMDAGLAPRWQEVRAQQTESITFQFKTTVDATAVGLTPSEPYVFTYTFAPDLPAGSGPFGQGENLASYGPLTDAVLEVAGECIHASSPPGSGITVFNDAGTGTPEDSYDVRFEDPEGTLGLQLFGLQFIFTRFLLVDPEATMFSDTSLPLSTTFAQAANFRQVSLDLRDPDTGDVSLSSSDESPFELQEIGTPTDAIAKLTAQVQALSLPEKDKQSLLKLLDMTSADLAAGKNAKALDDLDKFVKEVQKLEGKGLDAATVATLTASANDVRDAIPGC